MNEWAEHKKKHISRFGLDLRLSPPIFPSTKSIQEPLSNVSRTSEEYVAWVKTLNSSGKFCQVALASLAPREQ